VALEEACSLTASWVQEIDYNAEEGENGSTAGRFFNCLTGGVDSTNLGEGQNVVLISNTLHESNIVALKVTCL
jgi:hypothetical protein